MQYSLNKNHQHHKWQQLRSWISSPDCQVAMDKQQMQYRLTPKWNGGCYETLKNSQIRMSRHLDTSTTTQMAWIMVQYGRPNRSSWKESVRSSFGRTFHGKAIWESPIETWMGENFKLGMSLRSSWKRIILICVCGRHKIGWNTILIRCGKYSISVFTQVKLEDAHKLWKIPKTECPDTWIRLPRHKWPKSWSSMEDPVAEKNLYGHLSAALFGKNNLRKSYWNMPGRKFQIGNVSFVHREKGLFLSVYVDDIKLAGKKQNIDPMLKLLNKEVDLGEPTSFLDHEYLGSTQRQCEIRRDSVDNYRTMFESRIPAGGVEKSPFPQISVFLHGLVTWLVMQRSV